MRVNARDLNVDSGIFKCVSTGSGHGEISAKAAMAAALAARRLKTNKANELTADGMSPTMSDAQIAAIHAAKMREIKEIEKQAAKLHGKVAFGTRGKVILCFGALLLLLDLCGLVAIGGPVSRPERANFEATVRGRKCGSRKDHYSPG